MSQKEIAVRLFNNHKYGTTQGKGIYNKAVYNANVELRKPSTKYLLDFYCFDDWANKAKTDEQVMTYKAMAEMGFASEKDALFSWVLHYDPLTKAKVSVSGVAVFNADATFLRLVIDDAVSGLSETWMLETVKCKNAGAKKPAYLASNVDVGNW